jgi:hypothetical protein
MKLVGALDSNDNGLIDPADDWGSYVTETDVDGNPITIGDEDLEGYEVQIVLEDDSSGLNIVPFASLTGTVSISEDLGTSFDDLEEGTMVWVTALKYRPENELSVSSLEAFSYDYDLFEWADLEGQASVEWALGVPANTTVYLWAYTDEDANEIVNESGDKIASGGTDDDGTLETTGDSEHDLYLDVAGG